MLAFEAMRFLETTLILVPAYGRTYASAAEMRAGWESGQDFKIKAGPYCSIRDLDKLQQASSSIYIVDYIGKHCIIVG
jgi:hypothetical protein